MTHAELEAEHPEIFAIARELRAKGATVRIRCIHDKDGNLIAGKRPEDMPAPGPVPEYHASPEPEAPYRGKPR